MLRSILNKSTKQHPTKQQLYRHLPTIVVYSYADACINHNNTIIKTSDTVLRKIFLSLYLKVCVWEGVGDRTELKHIDPHSIGHNRVSFPFSWAAQPETWGPTLLGAGFFYHILSPTGLVSKLTDFLSSPIYIIVLRPSCGRHNCTHSTHPRSRL